MEWPTWCRHFLEALMGFDPDKDFHPRRTGTRVAHGPEAPAADAPARPAAGVGEAAPPPPPDRQAADESPRYVN